MSAFKYAVSLGTDMLELDVHLTRDEQVVVAHDPNLKRVTRSHNTITELDYAELPPVKEQLPIDFMPGLTFSRSSVQGHRLPLLETVFQAFPCTPINIDIKVHNDLLITKVSELTKRYNREHLTVWGNFSDAITQRCYKENGNMCLLFSLRRVVMLIVQLYTGLLPFMPLKETHLEILMPIHALGLYQQRRAVAQKNSGVDAGNNGDCGANNPSSGTGGAATATNSTGSNNTSGSCNVAPVSTPWWMRQVASLAQTLIIRPALFSHLAKRGIQTYLWVLNSEEDFHRAFKSGATGVMTDYPSKLKSFLAENPQYMLNYPQLETSSSQIPVPEHSKLSYEQNHQFPSSNVCDSSGSGDCTNRKHAIYGNSCGGAVDGTGLRSTGASDAAADSHCHEQSCDAVPAVTRVADDTKEMFSAVNENVRLLQHIPNETS
uniref:Glycerophosphodiester phosphodiesterase domain-containing protein 1-like n=1 Tax=Hirondellea gigas TaxID=1518452 RepID=A0A6A7FVV7_9CRUS